MSDSEISTRLIEYEDLIMCNGGCEDFWCLFHEMHFADCTCELRIWAEDNLILWAEEKKRSGIASPAPPESDSKR